MNNRIRRFYFLSLALILAVSFYPICMAVQVGGELLRSGVVPMERYPKYIIPYVPISLALFFGVLLMPLFQKMSKKLDLLWGVIASTGIFFAAERLMETKILVQAEELVSLEGWQMSMCYVPPEMYQTRTWQAVDVLLGGYSPAFKLHFYLIAIVLILSLLNCFYGFAKLIRTGTHTGKTALTMQAATSILFLGMCIWACFTSFYRTGELTVSAISAVLMAAFFILLGVTAGMFVASFTLGKGTALSIFLPAAAAAAMTLAMYIGETVLLNGTLYRFGSGFFFDGFGALAVAPVDLLIILVSAGMTALICYGLKNCNK